MVLIVTGDSGFVGQVLTNTTRVVPFRDPSGERIDLLDAAKCREFFCENTAEYVIHLAAQTHVPTSFTDPKKTFDVNFFGTLNVLEALKASGFKGRFLYVGSSEEYGLIPESDLPIVESQPLKPRNPYAVSKVAAEALCYQWSVMALFDIIMARPFNHIGPGQNEKFAIPHFAKQIIDIKNGRQEATIQVGDLLVTRDFTDVRDVVDAYLLLLEKGKNGEAYNVCSGQERLLDDILKDLLLIAGVEARVVSSKDLIRRAEQRRVQGSFAKLEKDTGWRPKIAIRQTLKDILQFWET